MSRTAKHPVRDGCIAFLLILGPWLHSSGCARVDTILLTSEKFPPKTSVDEVAVLERNPARPFRQIAELRIGDSWLSFGSLQRRILSQAAVLGADAVVFSSPQTLTRRRWAYQPMYDPWGANSPFYGPPWGYGVSGGYGGPYGTWNGVYADGLSVPMPYDETTRMLMGTAIRYTGRQTHTDRKASGDASLPSEAMITPSLSEVSTRRSMSIGPPRNASVPGG